MKNYAVREISGWWATNNRFLNTNNYKKIKIFVKNIELTFNYIISKDFTQENCNCVRDLEVYIDKRLSFNHDIKEITLNARRVFEYFIRSTYYFSYYVIQDTLYHTKETKISLHCNSVASSL